ncbi:MAG: NHLP bacteriocin export ABC transporter permease/ATPase subunit [Acidimicrobiia bacterium]|nr:NHLP bacteriocin export ABC transporter permease/ATPase subunit [Acidimicrobiia bacterium]
MPEAPEAGQSGELAAMMTAHAERLEVGANHPQELSAGASLFVRTGALDLFAQPVEADGYGARHLIATAGAGALLWGGDFLGGHSGWRLLAVGRPGTELLRLDNAALLRQAGEEAVAARFARFVADARAAHGLLPATPAEADGQGGPRPSTRPADGQPPARLADATAAFGAVVGDIVQEALDEDAAEAERINSERVRAHRLLDSALTDLVEVVDRGAAPGRAPIDDLAQLDLALARVCAALGVPYPEKAWFEPGGDPVAARVSAAGCRKRIVTLDAGWWSKPAVPLLGFVADGQDGDRPVALVPGRSGHVMFDPATGTTRQVDRALAGRLSSRAYAVYPPLPADAASARTLFRTALGHLRGGLGLLVALGLLAGLVTLLTPIVAGLVYSSVLPQGDRSLLAAVCALLGGATVAWGLVSFSRNLVLVRLDGLVQARLEPGLTDRLLRLPSTFFRSYDTGDLATRADGLEIIHQQLSGAVATSLLTLVFSVFNVGLLFAYSVVLGAVSLAILAAVVTALVAMNVREIRYQTGIYEHSGEVASDLFQVILAIQKVRVAAAETRFMARWAERYRRQATDIYLAGRIDAGIFALITALPAVLAVALYALTATVLNNSVTPGQFIALITALGQFTAAVTGMALTVGPLFTIVPLWQRLLPILAEPVEEEVGTGDPGRLLGRIELRDVTFGYTGASAPALRTVSLQIRPGEFVAITGPSGAGKSTLLRLLLGLDRPTSGTILYDGKDLAGLDASAVRRQFGVVMQGARPLPGEILSIILGDSAGDEQAAWAAAETAALAEDIRRMPMGMSTIVGEGGQAFSGGQVQRMMLARALARHPRFLFFDEATSALDDRAQQAVSEHIDKLDTTRIVIAHRLSTIRHADCIYVVDGGRLVQQGTYEELMATDGLFRNLTSRQLL